MNSVAKYLVAVLGIACLLGIVAWMHYYNKSTEQTGVEDSFQADLDKDVADLMAQVQVTRNYHYMLAYHYRHPILSLAILPPSWEILLTEMTVLIVTPDEIFLRKLGNGLTFAKARPAGLTSGLIRISKKAIQSFSVRNWKKWYFFGYFLTLKTRSQTYYLQVREQDRLDFSVGQFRKWKEERFMGLVTEDITF